MKKLLAVTAIAMAISSASAFADDTAVLKVAGKLTNGPCTPTLTNGGVIDFGNKYVGDLATGVSTQWGHKDFTFSITCDADTYVAWSLVDNRADSAVKLTYNQSNPDNSTANPNNEEIYGVGKTKGGVNLGSYVVTVDKSHVGIMEGADAVSGFVGQSNIGTGSQTSNWVAFASNGYLISPTAEYTSADGNRKALPFTSTTWPLRVTLTTQDPATLKITENTPIDGDATITLRYL